MGIGLFVLGSVLGVLPVSEKADREILTRGVESIRVLGTPGPLCVVGGRAFPVVVGRSGSVQEPVVAAARMGGGRVVVFGHPGYIGVSQSGGNATLLENAIRWASGRPSSRPEDLTVGVAAGSSREYLANLGYDARPLSLGDLGDLDVVIAEPRNQSESASLQDFVSRGGGLVTGGLGWGWKQLNRGRDLVTEHPGNNLLASAGIVFSDGYLEQTAPGTFLVGEDPGDLVRADRALEALGRHEKGTHRLDAAQSMQASAVVTRATRALPSTDRLFMPAVKRHLRGVEASDLVPTDQAPFGPGHPLRRVLLAYQLHELAGTLPSETTAHPAAADFPGSVPAEAPRVRVTTRVDTSVPDWHGTGLYAPPGEVIRIRIPATAERLGLGVRIGCHRDTLWHKKKWTRVPAITIERPLGGQETEIASAFGGLIYVVVPRNAPSGMVPVSIEGAVETPRYVHGETDLARWVESVRQAPGPWAEMESDRVVISVPSEVVRGLDRPDELMETWNQVLDLCASLSSRPVERARPERIVCDREISAGYMHSGYPIMTYLDQINNAVDASHLRKGNWGFFHELGHNHQVGDWTFGGTGEVTCNLFSLFIFERLCGADLDEETRMSRADRDRMMSKYDFNAPDFGQWKSSPFLALVMYVQIQREFGWEAYQRVFAEYRALAPGDRPRNDDEKRDQWLVRMSRTCGHNLGPFFTRWGIPTSEDARSSIENLPVWMPEELVGQ